MNTTLAAEFGRKGSVRVLLGPLEKIGSHLETRNGRGFALGRFAIRGGATVGINRRSTDGGRTRM
jgi:hypothetical protein